MNDMPIAQAFGLQQLLHQLHDVICHIVQILIRNFLEIQSLCKIHENFHIKALSGRYEIKHIQDEHDRRPQRRNV